ncbi:MAG TPA: aspartate aminotransferase family protein [bacterium]|nr:aspartate aminotransferase family protein [bacterium]HPO51879.1 aspartate aminotransferase family protein [bacterium]
MDEITVKQYYNDYIIGCYGKENFVFVKGKGPWLWDINGKKYLDFFPGWAVSGLGHCPTRVVKALTKQLKTLMHVANNYYIDVQALCAKKLIEISFDGKVFFCNSGAEANEAAIKLSRLYGAKTGRYKIISMRNSFHGRTLATVTMTGQEKYSAPFKPLPDGFAYAQFNDMDSLRSCVDEKTVAVIVEPIQGEGGINVADQSYLQSLRDFCNRNDLLLIFDEVQTGMGRTGNWFAFQHYGVQPDIMTLAKTLGGGFPVGAMIAGKNIAELLVPGTHASTFGGNPLACAAAIAVMETIEEEHLCENVSNLSVWFISELKKLQKKFPVIKEVRGIGFMIGMELEVPGKDFVERCRKNGLLLNCTHDTVIRIMPPLGIKKSLLKKGLGIIKKSLKEEFNN